MERPALPSAVSQAPNQINSDSSGPGNLSIIYFLDNGCPKCFVNLLRIHTLSGVQGVWFRRKFLLRTVRDQEQKTSCICHSLRNSAKVPWAHCIDPWCRHHKFQGRQDTDDPSPCPLLWQWAPAQGGNSQSMLPRTWHLEGLHCTHGITHLLLCQSFALPSPTKVSMVTLITPQGHPHPLWNCHLRNCRPSEPSASHPAALGLSSWEKSGLHAHPPVLLWVCLTATDRADPHLSFPWPEAGTLAALQPAQKKVPIGRPR